MPEQVNLTPFMRSLTKRPFISLGEEPEVGATVWLRMLRVIAQGRVTRSEGRMLAIYVEELDATYTVSLDRDVVYPRAFVERYLGRRLDVPSTSAPAPRPLLGSQLISSETAPVAASARVVVDELGSVDIDHGAQVSGSKFSEDFDLFGE